MSILALDFGGTRLRAACFDDALTLQARLETATLAHEPQQAVIDRIIGLGRQAWDDNVLAIGISAPCPMAYTGLIRHAAPGATRVEQKRTVR